MAWIKVQEYAKKHKVTPMAVYKKVRNHSLKTKKIKGVIVIQDNSPIAVKTASNEDKTAQIEQTEEQRLSNEEWSKLQNEQRKIKLELQIEKLKNLQQDTILKKLKQQSVKEYYRREFSEQVFQCVTDSFSDLKNYLIELKLNKQENQKLKFVFKKTIDKFRKKLSDNLKKKQKEEEQEKQDEVE